MAIIQESGVERIFVPGDQLPSALPLSFPSRGSWEDGAGQESLADDVAFCVEFWEKS